MAAQPLNASERDSSTSSPDDATPSKANAAQAAGRGALAIAFAKIYFMFTGLAQQVALGNILVGGGYGALSTAMGIASITYNPLIQTGIQGLSRPVAPADPASRPAVIRTALKVHFTLGVLVAAAFLLAAPLVADATETPYLVPTFRLFAAVLLAYALYGPLVGILNGQQKFAAQAGLDILAATLRTLCMVGVAWWFARRFGSGVQGAAVGFAGSAALMFCVAAVATGFGKAGASQLLVREHLKFIGPLLLGQFILNLLFQADLQLLGAFARDAAQAAGVPAARADVYVGAYRAAQLFAFLPYQLLIAISFVLFPLLARAHRDGDRGAVARYVRTGVRVALILAGLAVSVSSGLSASLLHLVFPAQPFDQVGAESMELLTIGLGAFAVFGILITALNSMGGERGAMLLTAFAFGLVASLCAAFVRGQPFGPGLLWRTALGTTTAHFVAVLCAGYLVKRIAGAIVEPLSAVRVIGCAAAAIALARQLPELGKVATIAASAGVAAVYVVLLTVTRELRGSDLAGVAGIVRRRRPS